MNAGIKAQWLAALRSGKYQQARKQLRDEERFCCLGVLCDIAANAGVGQWDDEEFLIKAGDEVMEVDYQVPSRAVQVWSELDERNPLVYGDLRLAMFNDGAIEYDLHPHTFDQIADLIETHL